VYVGCSNASGHRVVNQLQAENAARIVDAVYLQLRKVDEQNHRSQHAHRQIDALEARERGPAAGAPAAAGGPNKRPRIAAAAAAAPAAAAPAAAKPREKTWDNQELPVDEVIGRFLDGNEGLGPLNTQVCWLGWDGAAACI
jgi:hypothetical protein